MNIDIIKKLAHNSQFNKLIKLFFCHCLKTYFGDIYTVKHHLETLFMFVFLATLINEKLLRGCLARLDITI